MTFTPGGGLVNTTASTSTAKGTPFVVNIPILNAATEYSYALPSTCVSFAIKPRLFSKLQIAYVPGSTSSIYLTVPRGNSYAESELQPASRTLYFQSDTPGDTLEIIYWTT